MQGDYFYMKDRLEPCLYYICKGECTKGGSAAQRGICQTCKKYRPRKGIKVIDKRRKERDKWHKE